MKLFGEDMVVLQEIGKQLEREMKTIPGASDVKLEQTTGLPLLSITPRRDALARYGLSIADMQEVIEIALGGKSAGEVFEGDRRFQIVVRLPEDLRGDLDALEPACPPTRRPASQSPWARFASRANLETPLYHAHSYVPLSEIAKISVAQGPNMVNRENGKRRVVVSANVRGRDLGSFVDEAQKRIESNVDIPAGYCLRGAVSSSN